MGIASIILGIASMLFMFGGFLMTIVPGLGLVLSFGAPLLAIAGIVCGGVGMSRAKQMGVSSGSATAGLIVNIIAIVPALVVAMTCGLCNACVTEAALNPQDTPWWMVDGGTPPDGDPWGGAWGPPPNWPPPADVDAGQAAFPPEALPPGAPPPAFPPPPMPAADDAGGEARAPDASGP